MGLSTSDLGRGASVETEGPRTPRPPAIAEYQRIFRPGVQLGGYALFRTESFVYDFGDVGTATIVFGETRRQLSTQSGRRALAKRLTADVSRSATFKIVSLTVGPPVSMAFGDEALRITTRLHGKLQSRTFTIDVVYALLRLDRSVGEVDLASYPGKHVPASIAALGARKIAAHFKSGFTVRNLTPPSISGTPRQTQTLTANPGTWAGAPSGFTYQWSRCDSAGANCAPIPGAIAQTYLLGTTDVGARITVIVTAANSVTSVALGTTPTAAVT